MAFLTAFAVGTQSFAAASISNGSFENGTAPGSFTNIVTGGTNITDWMVDSGNVDYIGTYWVASDGSRSIDLNGTAAGSIKQTFATTVGATYEVTFDLSGNPEGTPGTRVVRVSATGSGTPSQDFTYDTVAKANTLADMKWESKTYTFIAGSTSTTLMFTSQTAGSNGPALDKIAIDETLPALETHTITVSAGANGTISPFGSVSVNHMDDQTFTITANTGYHVHDVMVDGVSVGAVTTYTFNDVNGNHTISVSFAADSETGDKPKNKEECKNGGWRSFTNPTFKNQGQCVTFVNHMLYQGPQASSQIEGSAKVGKGLNARANFNAGLMFGNQ